MRGSVSGQNHGEAGSDNGDIDRGGFPLPCTTRVQTKLSNSTVTGSSPSVA